MLVGNTPEDEARALGRFMLGGGTGQAEGDETISDVDSMERGWEKGNRAVKTDEAVREMPEGL